MTISEEQAWAITNEFTAKVAAALGDDLLSVVVIGSLSGGYYRPGVSDIDTVVVVTADARPAAEPLVERVREEYRVRYQVPKEFGAFVVTPEQLRGPYPPEEELAPEVQRIVDQGRVVYGGQVPIVPPSRAELLGYVHWFDQWLETEFLPTNPPETLDHQSAYTIAAMACRDYLFYRFGTPVIWEKRASLRTFQQHFPSDADADWVGRLAASEVEANGQRAVRLWRRLHRWIGAKRV